MLQEPVHVQVGQQRTDDTALRRAAPAPFASSQAPFSISTPLAFSAIGRSTATAQFNVGTNGQGVPQNYVLAYKWFSLSAAQGYTDAVKGRDFISARMTPAEVNEAQKLVPPPANIVISMRRVGGINVVPVLINDAITLYFVVDSGAADVSIPANVVSRLALADADFIGQRKYQLADGSFSIPTSCFISCQRMRRRRTGPRHCSQPAGSSVCRCSMNLHRSPPASWR